MKVLLTGANGQLGRCILDRVPADWMVLATDSEQLDITDYKKLEEYIAIQRPDVIINAAAYTAVDRAEQEPEFAQRVNTDAPGYLAELSVKYGCKLIHISTDYVFDGAKNSPYSEDDTTNPINVYGKTKRNGEVKVLAANSNAIILRTSWLFSEYGDNFVKTIIKLAREKEKLDVVNDQFGNPTYAGDIACSIVKIIDNDLRLRGGVYHCMGVPSVSRFDFTLYILTLAQKNNNILYIPSLNSVPTSKFTSIAKRPLYTVLFSIKSECSKLGAYDWKKNLPQVINKI